MASNINDTSSAAQGGLAASAATGGSGRPTTHRATEGFAPGCAIAILVLGVVLALLAVFIAVEKTSVRKVERELYGNPQHVEETPAHALEGARALDLAERENTGTCLGVAAVAYLFIYWSSLELWYSRKPTPCVFGRPLSHFSRNIPPFATGRWFYTYPLRHALYARPVLAGVLVYDVAVLSTLFFWNPHPVTGVFCGFLAAPFHLLMFLTLRDDLASQALHAAVYPASGKALAENGAVEVDYEIEACKKIVVLKLRLILIAIEAYYPDPPWSFESETQRLSVVSRAETSVWSDVCLEGGEHRRDTVVLRAPEPMPTATRHHGQLLWFVALVARTPWRPDLVVIERIEPVPDQP